MLDAKGISRRKRAILGLGVLFVAVNVIVSALMLKLAEDRDADRDDSGDQARRYQPIIRTNEQEWLLKIHRILMLSMVGQRTLNPVIHC